MEPTEEGFQKFLKTYTKAKSSRHHYIPRFYLSGFTNEKNNYFIYDKLRGSVRESSTKGSFYEEDRNTIENYKGEKSSFLEDAFYGYIDNLCAKPIKNLKENPANDEIFTLENVGGINAFVINLFIRNPKMDNIFDDFLDKSFVKLVDETGNEVDNDLLLKLYSEDKGMRKIHRAGLFKDAATRLNVKGKIRTGLVGTEEDMFLCSDFPIIYQSFPDTLEGIIQNEYFIPISTRRVYYTAPNSSLEWSHVKVAYLNALIIENATRYVCSPNKELLERSLRYYDKVKDGGYIELVTKELFSK
jgi:hypothetical protein